MDKVFIKLTLTALNIIISLYDVNSIKRGIKKMANNNKNNGGMSFWGMVGAILVALFIFSVIG